MNPNLLVFSNWFYPTLLLSFTAILLAGVALFYYRRSKRIEEMKIAVITEGNIVEHIKLISKILGLQAVVSSRATRVFIRGEMSLTNGSITVKEFFRKSEMFFKILVKTSDEKTVPLFIQESSGDFHLGRKCLDVKEKIEEHYIELPHIDLTKDDPGPEENAPPHGNNTREKINISELLNEGSELEGNEDNK